MIYLGFTLGCSICKLKSEMLFVLISYFAYVQQGLGPLVWKTSRFYKCILILSLEILATSVWALLVISVIISRLWIQHNHKCRGPNSDTNPWTIAPLKSQQALFYEKRRTFLLAEQKLVVFIVNEPSYYTCTMKALWKINGPCRLINVFC